MNLTAAPDFAHLGRMSDDKGTFEHARFDQPRPEHGYCTDDMARVLVVTVREPRPTPSVRRLVESSLRFLAQAQGLDGGYRNRMDQHGRWTDEPTLDDCWGRSVWALGTAVARSDSEWLCDAATSQFERAAERRPSWPRSRAFAALGAAELLSVRPDNRAAGLLLDDLGDQMAGPSSDPSWPWPEPRLSYANAAIPEALIAAGDALSRPTLVRDGLRLLAWLLERETLDGHLSVTPVGGAGPGDVGPAFDQQPIEVAALADACARAATVDGDERWKRGVTMAVGWFLGDNDGDVVMWDRTTGGGYDGLQRDGANLNQGAESTLALLSTLQHGRHLVPAGR